MFNDTTVIIKCYTLASTLGHGKISQSILIPLVPVFNFALSQCMHNCSDPNSQMCTCLAEFSVKFLSAVLYFTYQEGALKGMAAEVKFIF